MTAPCLNCPQRHLGCHGGCDKYQAYDKERQLIRKNRGAEMFLHHELFAWRDERRRWPR